MAKNMRLLLMQQLRSHENNNNFNQAQIILDKSERINSKEIDKGNQNLQEYWK